MIIYKCDRCKKEIHSDTQKYDIYSDERIHLCPKCTEAFEKFLDGEEIKPYLFGNHIESVAVDDVLIGPMGGFKDANV